MTRSLEGLLGRFVFARVAAFPFTGDANLSTENIDELENTRKEAALALIDRGFYVLPVKAGEKRPDPLLAPNGVNDATRDRDVVAGWFDVKPRANVAIACGAVFGIVVLDVDVKNGARGPETLERLWISEPTLTLTATSPSGGEHLYLRHPGVALISKLDGIDIKGADGNGYVLAPPSTLSGEFANSSGCVAGLYVWRDEEMPIAVFPEFLLKELAAKRNAPKGNGAATGPVASIKTPDGKRHNRLVDLGKIYRSKGLRVDEIEALLWWHATENFTPPFSRENAEEVRELESIVHWYKDKGTDGDNVVPFVILSTAELRERGKLTPQVPLLDPVLPDAGSMMIYGAAGIGKSHIGLCIAGHLALGRPFLEWAVRAPVPVLYVDGEMPLDEITERLDSYFGGDPLELLNWIAARAQDNDLPNLADPVEQDLYYGAVTQAGAKCVVFDNLTCLRSTSAELPENSIEAWLPVARFIRRLNRLGIAVVVIHHASKAGQQRGSVGHVAPMDTVVCLRALQEGQADPLAENDIEFVFEKHRRFGGEAAQPFRAKALGDPGGHVIWQRVGTDALVDDVVRLRKQGVSVRDIAAKLKRSKAGIQKAIARAKGRALLPLGEANE